MTDLNDPLSNLFDGDTGPVREYPIRQNAVEYKPATQRFEEGCDKCKGSGNFVSYTGRIVGQCFACKGLGKKVFKTSPATRENNREKAAERKEKIMSRSVEDFKAANQAEYEWLVSTAPRWDVAASLLAGLHRYGDLTEKQMGLIRNAIARDVARAVARENAVTNAPTVDVSAIEKAFAVAREKAARVGQMGTFVKPLKLAAGTSKDDVAFKCSAGDGKWAGMVFFKSLDDRKLGYVKAGKFIRQFACTDAEANAVVTVASNPKEGLIAYAKAWSRCGVCGRGLLADESIERGIGPICFGKYGLA